MSGNSIVVIGSSNTDMVINSEHLPVPGETVLGGQFAMHPGGKGANQAVAAARLGGEVTFITRLGNDIFGQNAIEGFKGHKINTDHITIDDETPSGVALIMVDKQGENCISVALGANETLDKKHIDSAFEIIRNADFLLLQLEIPVDTVEYVVDAMKNEEVHIVLNPAPAQSLKDSLLQSLDIITPNETEAEILTGIKVTDESTARESARILRSKGIKTVIITMGAQGVYVLSDDLDQMVPCPKVDVVDTTAAGDTFNGALVVALSAGKPLHEAILFANKAAAYSVTRVGAQTSAPGLEDIKNL